MDSRPWFHTLMLLVAVGGGCGGRSAGPRAPPAGDSGTPDDGPPRPDTGDTGPVDTGSDDTGEPVELAGCEPLGASVVARGYWDIDLAGEVLGALVVDDLDGDGHSDVVVPTSLGTWVGLGGGDGTLARLGTFGPSAASAAVADLDADGWLDLVVLSSGGDLLSFRGTGTRFDDPEPLVLGCDVPGQLQVADLDLDGDPDVVGVCGTSGLLVALDDGGVLDVSLLPSGRRPSSLRVADLDGDGAPDLLHAGGGETEQLVYRGDGMGGFTADTLSTEQRLELVEVGDHDGDGDVDIVASIAQTTELAWLDNDGAGAFTEQTLDELWGSYDSTKYRADRMSSADLDADGIDDLLLVSNDTLGVRLGTPVGLAEGTWTWIEDWVEGAVAGDFDEDGRLDLAVAASTGVLSIRLQRADGGISQATMSGETSIDPDVATLFDYNGDGVEDVLGFDSTNLYLWLSDGSGGWVQAWSDDLGGGSGPGTMVAGDLDGDGWLDAVVVDGSGTDAVLVFDLDEAGAVASRTPIELSDEGGHPRSMVLVDLDGEGDLDVVVDHHSHEELRVLLGDGFGGLSLPVAVDLGFDVEHLVAGDFDGDGLADVAAASHNDLVVLTGDADRGLRILAALVTDERVEDLAAGDVDGDGDDDLALIPYGIFAPVLLRNDGGGESWTFEDLGLRGSIYESEFPALVDLNGDGALDLVWKGGVRGTAWSCGDGTGGFGARQPLPFRGPLHSQPQVVSGRSPLTLSAVAGEGVSLVVVE